jgi:hypothetical protein
MKHPARPEPSPAAKYPVERPVTRGHVRIQLSEEEEGLTLPVETRHWADFQMTGPIFCTKWNVSVTPC